MNQRIFLTSDGCLSVKVEQIVGQKLAKMDGLKTADRSTV